MRNLLDKQKRSTSSDTEAIDLAILTELWSIREPAGGPIEQDCLDPWVIMNNITSKTISSHVSLREKVKKRINVLKQHGMIEEV